MNLPKSEAFEAMEARVLDLQARIVQAVEKVDGRAFAWKDWTRAEGGGGRMATIRGDVVEKGAVLTSNVRGATNPLTGNPFRAVGLSLILHPLSPHAPTVHMNVRRFEEEGDAWWGGGTDITPMGVRHAEDVSSFHAALSRRLGARYAEGKAEADRYFFVPHRNRARGAGGVFYDHLRDADWRAGFRLLTDVGEALLEGWLPLLEKRGREPATDEERARQAADRGVYVEFNLLYDRGTRFGFQSGGNPEAILASLPPTASW